MAETPAFDAVIEGLVAGQSAAAEAVFDRFRSRMVALARQRLFDPRLQAKFDPDDVVQSAFLTFWRRAREGQFEIDDWELLWNLLAKITERRCRKYWRQFQGTAKRDLGRESSGIADSESQVPDPLRSAIVADVLDRLLTQLDENSQMTLVLKLQGFTETEICDALKCSERSVRRRMARIRELIDVDEFES